MLFNSIPFIFLFLPCVLAGFFLIGRYSRIWAARWLALASLFFYGWWDTRYILLLLGSIIGNFYLGQKIAQAKRTKKFYSDQGVLWLGVVLNLSLLGYYKYAAFFVQSLTLVSGLDLQIGEVILPLGISFFTFTQIAFLVDCRQGKVHEYNFSHYLLFVTYFPHLIAGPVLHHAQMMPQFKHDRTYHPNAGLMAQGIMFFTLGLFKKVVVADGIAEFVAPVFSAAAGGYSPGFFEANSAAFAYAMQLYFDFSGYSDMAVGLSLMFGVRLPFNFNSPYKAESIVDFWRRWHMTLSAFLRDYLYIALGGNQRGHVRRYVNLLLTMLLGGLWHGAAWTFVVWGGLHGLLLALNHAWGRLFNDQGWRHTWWWRVVSRLSVFVMVVLLWVVFRSADMASAERILAGMFALNGFASQYPIVKLNWVIWPLLVVMFAPNTQEIVDRCSQMLNGVDGLSLKERLGQWLMPLIFAVLFWWALGRINRVSEFLYFQF